MSRSVYNSRRWRRVRADVLRSAPLCADCESRGIVTAAHEVDHVIPMRFGGDPWDPANLQALCKECHSRKTAAERRGPAKIRAWCYHGYEVAQCPHCNQIQPDEGLCPHGWAVADCMARGPCGSYGTRE